jgi:hypothetical protein
MEDQSTRDMLAELLEGQRALSAKVELLLNSQMRAPENPNCEVGWEYIHERTGLAQRTITDRKGGVKDIALARRKPRRWFRGDVDKWLRERREAAKTPKQRAYRLLSRKGKRQKM